MFSELALASSIGAKWGGKVELFASVAAVFCVVLVYGEMKAARPWLAASQTPALHHGL